MPEARRHFGVYAVIYDHDKKNLLLIKKSRGPYTGMFDMPGGTPEPSESEKETLHREVHEETGCNVVAAQYMQTISIDYEYEQAGSPCIFQHTGAIYKVDINGMPLPGPDGHDSLGCAWVAINDLRSKNATPLLLKILIDGKNATPVDIPELKR